MKLSKVISAAVATLAVSAFVPLTADAQQSYATMTNLRFSLPPSKPYTGTLSLWQSPASGTWYTNPDGPNWWSYATRGTTSSHPSQFAYYRVMMDALSHRSITVNVSLDTRWTTACGHSHISMGFYQRFQTWGGQSTEWVYGDSVVNSGEVENGQCVYRFRYDGVDRGALPWWASLVPIGGDWAFREIIVAAQINNHGTARCGTFECYLPMRVDIKVD